MQASQSQYERQPEETVVHQGGAGRLVRPRAATIPILSRGWSSARTSSIPIGRTTCGEQRQRIDVDHASVA
ncbi:MAG: hypothetical protein CMJ54_11580 [Planctomycetaceae bacterium]|nr:hypothetical protein [Planctomycetaceae bacterium]